jgi:trehalose 6-phosphate phosphatase
LKTTQAIEILASDPATTGLFTDFDGTLSPVAPTPEEAMPADGAGQALESLADAYALVAIVSGRSLEDLKTRLRPRGVLLAGAYGRERSDSPTRRATEGWETVGVAASATVAKLPGVRLERKGAGIALHYRQAPEAAEDVRKAAELLAREFELEIRPGRRVVELVVPGPGKGDAMVKLAGEKGLETVFVAGDDAADLEAFLMVRAQPIRSVIAAVSSEEAPEGLTDQADFVFARPDELVSFFEELVAAVT